MSTKYSDKWEAEGVNASGNTFLWRLPLVLGAQSCDLIVCSYLFEQGRTWHWLSRGGKFGRGGFPTPAEARASAEDYQEKLDIGASVEEYRLPVIEDFRT